MHLVIIKTWLSVSLPYSVVCVQGDFDEDGDRGGRFRGKPLEPYTKQLADE